MFRLSTKVWLVTLCVCVLGENSRKRSNDSTVLAGTLGAPVLSCASCPRRSSSLMAPKVNWSWSISSILWAGNAPPLGQHHSTSRTHGIQGKVHALLSCEASEGKCSPEDVDSLGRRLTHEKGLLQGCCSWIVGSLSPTASYHCGTGEDIGLNGRRWSRSTKSEWALLFWLGFLFSLFTVNSIDWSKLQEVNSSEGHCACQSCLDWLWNYIWTQIPMLLSSLGVLALSFLPSHAECGCRDVANSCLVSLAVSFSAWAGSSAGFQRGMSV